MPDLRTAEMLQRMAHKDMLALGGMISEEVFADEVFGFHAQQAVEKTLKCWICLVEDLAPRTHDLEELLRLLEDNGVQVPSAFKELADLTDFAVIFRYGEIELDTHLDRDEVHEHVADLVVFVDALLRNALLSREEQ